MYVSAYLVIKMFCIFVSLLLYYNELRLDGIHKDVITRVQVAGGIVYRVLQKNFNYF